MNFQHQLEQIKDSPNFCKYCNKLSEFVLQVLKTDGQGQYQGMCCLVCTRPKQVRHVPYKSKHAYNIINDKYYRRQFGQG